MSENLTPDAPLHEMPQNLPDATELTEKQLLARARLKKQTAKLIEEDKEKRRAQAQRKERLREKAAQFAAAEEVRTTAEETLMWDMEPGVPEVVYSPEDAPEGPPWRYEPTPDRKAEKQAKKLRRAKTKSKIKHKALDKTPQSLKNASDLQIRTRTALVYTLLTIFCVLAGDIPMLIYLMVVAGICAGEFYYMLRSDAKLPNEMLGIGGAVLYLPATYFFGFPGALIVTIVLLLLLIVWYVFWLKARVQDVGVSFFGAAYTGLLLCGLMIIRQSLDSFWGGVVVLLLFLSVWANDAFAYFIGSRFGKHKLAPRVSPKKSWEGFFAGLVGSALVWLVISFVPGVTMPPALAILFGLICGLAEVLGDLAESRIKRNSGFKDSGTIMPGHGGLLDRCDSLFLASTMAAILMLAGGCIPYNIF